MAAPLLVTPLVCLSHATHTHTHTGAFRRAEPLLRNALELMWRELRGPHPYTAKCYATLGAVLAKAGKLQDAGTQLQQAADIYQVRLPSCMLPLLHVTVQGWCARFMALAALC